MSVEAPEKMWAKVTVEVSAEAAEGVADVLLAAAGGIEERRRDCRVRLVAYLPADRDAEGDVQRIRGRLEALRAAGIDVGRTSVTLRRVRSEPWEEAWKAGFDVIRIPPRLAVKPTWKEYVPQPGEVVVELDPGMAFGTGSHATTRGCLAALGRAVSSGSAVFDIGAGSGILSIAAARLGARRVVAVEIDESAGRVARRNVVANGVEDTVVVICADGLRCLCGRADVIVANLTSDHIARLARDVVAHLEPGGVFIASGVAAGHEAAVRAAAEGAGLGLREAVQEEEWVTMVWEVRGDATAAG